MCMHAHAHTHTDPRGIVTCVVCVCYTQMHTLTCECVHSCVCVCAEVMVDIKNLSLSSALFVRQVSLNWKLMICLDWLTSKLRDLPVSAYPAVGLQTYRRIPSCPVFMQVYGLQTHTIMPSFCVSIGESKTRPSCSYSKYFTQRAISPVLDFDFQSKQTQLKWAPYTI